MHGSRPAGEGKGRRSERDLLSPAVWALHGFSHVGKPGWKEGSLLPSRQCCVMFRAGFYGVIKRYSLHKPYATLI